MENKKLVMSMKTPHPYPSPRGEGEFVGVVSNHTNSGEVRNRRKLAVTMAEIMIVVVIVAIVAGVFLAMPKKNVSKMDRAKYYIAYDLLKRLQDEQMANTGSVRIDKTTFGCAVNEWLNVVNLYNSTANDSVPLDNPTANCRNAVKATLTNGMVLTWGDKTAAETYKGKKDEARIFSEDRDYLKVTVDLDGDIDENGNQKGLNTLNKDQYVFHLFDNGWVRPDMCYKNDGVDCSGENDSYNVAIVLPFRVYGFDSNGKVENYLYNVDYTTAYDLYKCSVPSQDTRNCSEEALQNCNNNPVKPCIMEAIPPLK